MHRGATARQSDAQQDHTSRLVELCRRLTILTNRIGAMEEMADGILADLTDLVADLEDTALTTAPPRRVKRRIKAEAARVLSRAAEGGAYSLKIVPRTNGEADVRIDEGTWFTLPSTLTELLRILAQDFGSAADEFVGWKTKDEVAILLGKNLSKQFNTHAVTQLVHRLRKELLDQGGVNSYLVQTNRQHGLRFALRQPGREHT
ncbi:MAG: hypothetical protein GY906_08160 [bacterium]|nr:hypothetical protein [bacterium]